MLKKTLRTLVLIMAFQFSNCFAETPTLTNLSSSDLNNVMTDFASNFAPPNSGAASLGSIFGFELGLIAGVTDSPSINTLSNGDLDKMPYLTLFARIDTLYGLGFEFSILPIDEGGFEYNYTSIGVKWRFSDMLDLPLNLMVKINFTNADLAWEVTESTHTSKITYEHSSTAISLIASKKLLIIPYLSLNLQCFKI